MDVAEAQRRVTQGGTHDVSMCVSPFAGPQSRVYLQPGVNGDIRPQAFKTSGPTYDQDVEEAGETKRGEMF